MYVPHLYPKNAALYTSETMDDLGIVWKFVITNKKGESCLQLRIFRYSGADCGWHTRCLVPNMSFC